MAKYSLAAKAAKRRYYERNRKAVIAASSAWAKEHREIKRAISKRHYRKKVASNPEYRVKRGKQYKEWRLLNKRSQPWIWLVYGARARASEYGDGSFDLTTSWAKERYQQGSALSGRPFIHGDGCMGAFSPSIDRIDNSKGYTQDNCRLVLLMENSFKQTCTDVEMLSVAADMLRRAGYSVTEPQ